MQHCLIADESLCTLTFQEAREHQLEREKVEEEMRELSDAVEMATLDKEMAEEKVCHNQILQQNE